jgi:hypothetical protein
MPDGSVINLASMFRLTNLWCPRLQRYADAGWGNGSPSAQDGPFLSVTGRQQLPYPAFDVLRGCRLPHELEMLYCRGVLQGLIIGRNG